MKPLPQKSGRLGLYAALLLAVILLMLALRQCSAPRPVWGEPERRPGGDTINVAIEYSPTALVSLGGDSLGGFGYELMQELARREGLNVSFRPVVKLQSTLERLDSGFYDIVIAEMPVTAEMRQRFRFSQPVFIDRQVLVQRHDSTGRLLVESQLDLGGHRVTVVAGSPAVERLQSLAREIGDTIIIDTDSLHSPEQIFLLTAVGEIPLAVINESTARQLQSDYPDIDISTAVSFSQFQSWVLTSRKPAMAARIDSALTRLKASGEYRRLLERYSLSPAD